VSLCFASRILIQARLTYAIDVCFSISITIIHSDVVDLLIHLPATIISTALGTDYLLKKPVRPYYRRNHIEIDLFSLIFDKS